MKAKCSISPLCALAFLLVSGVWGQYRPQIGSFFDNFQRDGTLNKPEEQEDYQPEPKLTPVDYSPSGSEEVQERPSFVDSGYASRFRQTRQRFFDRFRQNRQKVDNADDSYAPKERQVFNPRTDFDRLRQKVDSGGDSYARADSFDRASLTQMVAPRMRLRGSSMSASEQLQAAFAAVRAGKSRSEIAAITDSARQSLHKEEAERETLRRDVHELDVSMKKILTVANGIFARPMLIQAGGMVDLSSGEGGFASLPLHDIYAKSSQGDNPLQAFHQNMFALLDSQMHSQRPSNCFHTDEHDGHFRLRASLPWYKMHRNEGEEDQPLSVHVVGNSLVVLGHKSDGQVVKTFQRSFKLPKTANPDAMKVTYSVSSGGFSVEVPKHSGEAGGAAHAEAFDPEEDGSQTTVVVAAGGAVQESAPDTNDETPTRALATAASPTDLLASVTGADNAAKIAVVSQEGTLGAEGMQAAPVDKTPVVVQRKGSKPFWRLVGNDGGRHSSIEVVLPEGWEMGEPGGKTVTFLGGGSLELPVSINGPDCVFLGQSEASSEHVLQCKIVDSVVKKIPIKVDDEL